MDIKEFYIDPEFEMIVYSLDDVIHTSTIITDAVTDEGQQEPGDIFDGENVNIDINGDIDFFD